jgi:NAD-dependent deacetylase
LTGSGLSSESGIATFRDEGEHWRVGARSYHPVELATRMAFERMPADIWGWYLYRRSCCRMAEPNAAHHALAALEARLAERFLLVTENVDGLHLRAGSSAARTYQIHGTLDAARCAAECHTDARALPASFAVPWPKQQRTGDGERPALSCDRCQGWLRPDVLWFDEPYDEDRFHADSSLQAARDAALMVVVGADGASVLPTKMCQSAVARGAPLIVVDSDATPIAEMAATDHIGLTLWGDAISLVPKVCEAIAARFA